MRRKSAGDAGCIDGPAGRVFQGHARLQFDICGSHPKIVEMIRRFSDRSLVSAFLTAQSSLSVISQSQPHILNICVQNITSRVCARAVFDVRITDLGGHLVYERRIT
jgi:hypothetical protein